MPSKNDPSAPPPRRDAGSGTPQPVNPSAPPPLALMTESFPGRPVYDTAVSHALLRQVAAGTCPETLRLYVPDEVALFSVLDRRNPGFAPAISAADARGCPSLLRLAGGSAALFHRQCLAFAWAIPEARSAEGIRSRFEAITALMRRALERVGVDARIGAVPGEYCPGDYSINAGGRIKLLGVGQRVIRGAAHVGGVLVVRDADRVREVLAPVYHELGLSFDAATVGSVEDCVPGVSLEEVGRAIRAEFAAVRGLVESGVGAATRDLAAELEVTHSVNAPGTGTERAGLPRPGIVDGAGPGSR